MTNPNESASPQTNAGLGTFAGVFTPSVLTILGIILFLRLGYVVGNAGLMRAFLIIGLANLISVLTSVSLSAIATNLRVKGGGDYYLISRTLGLQYGGAIGIVLFLAQSVSIAFYCIGFGEAITHILPVDVSTRIIALSAVAFLFIFAWMGADWATRFQYVVMVLLTAALVSFFWGGFLSFDAATLSKNWARPSGGPGFWLLFAIFFPAVTGFTQGVSMSGDLKDPGKSLPVGTFLAVGISIIVYFAVAIIFAGSLPQEVMMRDYGSFKLVARIGFLIDAGVIAATLSSAMASFLGAPRILQSLASDRIFTWLLPFAKGSGATGNPRRGVLLSAAIAIITISLGNLNVIAPIVSMFFLISYGLLNYATFFEARAASPSFRPRFKWFDHRLSLLGFLACLGAMLAIDVTAGAIAISVLFAIYQYLKRTTHPVRWADSRRSYHIQRVRDHLLAATTLPEHDRDWRPKLLALSGDSKKRRELLSFASWIEGGTGFTTAVRILVGKGLGMLKQKKDAEVELSDDIAALNVEAFPLVVVAPGFEDGIHTMVQTFGIGPLKANTLLLNWFEQVPEGALSVRGLRYGRNLRTAFRLGCNIIILDTEKSEWSDLEKITPDNRQIDVWWFNDATSRLMLLLAHLMTRHPAWSKARIRVLAAGYDRISDEFKEDLRQTIDEVRIEAESKIVLEPGANAVVQNSAHASMVFLPFRFRGNHVVNPFGGDFNDLFTRLPVVALVVAAEDIDLDPEPEEGKVGEMAAAMDAVAERQKKADLSKKDAEQASLAAEKAQARVDEFSHGDLTDEDEKKLAEMKNAAEAAARQAEKMMRRAAKAQAGLDAVAKALAPTNAKQSDPDDTPPTSSK